MTVENYFKAACIQFNPILNERDNNIEELLKLVYEAAENGAKLIVTPEMATTGYYYPNRHAIQPFVDTIPGITTARFEEVCRVFNIYVVIGMPEVDTETDIYYNAAALIGPDGYIGKYRKIHLWEWETHWSAVGDLGVPVMETQLGSIAINICMDSIFFESSRLAVLNGADILAFPTNSSAQSISFLQARAETNGLYILSANRSNVEQGVKMVGASAIWSPFGKKLAEAPVTSNEEYKHNNPESVIIYAVINKNNYQNQAKNRLKERVPTIYKELLHYIAPWDFTKNDKEMEITAAIVQCEPLIGDKERNLYKHKRLIEQVCQNNKNIQLIVLPELATTGPVGGLKKDEIMLNADTMDSPYIKQYCQLAMDYNVTIIVGCIEKSNLDLFNTALLIDNFGIIRGKYRKIHLTKEDRKWAKPGNKVGIFSTEHLGKIGIMIGYDVLFPELAGVLTVNRADTIVIPSLWNNQFGKEIAIHKNLSKKIYPKGANTIYDVTALGSQAYVIVANSVNTSNELGGRSGLYTIDPLYGLDQPVLASANKEEVMTIRYKTLQKDWWFNQEKLITLRRTTEYKPLIL